MEEKSTLLNGGRITVARFLSLSIALVLISITTSAQVFCANETVIFSENFGVGTAPTRHESIRNVNFQRNGNLNEGRYRVINNTGQRPGWHASDDHTTGDVDGQALIINGTAETFYTELITNGTAGFTPGNYTATMYAMNLSIPGTCTNPLLPVFALNVEYNTFESGHANEWIQLPTQTTQSLPETTSPTWVRVGGTFTIPETAQRVRLTITSVTGSGCGNDFAIDDIQFAACPLGGPLPVNFLALSAGRQGGSVAIRWSTSSEINNKYFYVEKSTDGVTWTTINSVNGAGNSNAARSYTSYDAKPAAGYNYYRIKQVDADGRFKYSDIVKVNIEIDRIGASVLTNPFVNNITVDFLSPLGQTVNVRLADISGKVLGTERWKIAKGSSRMTYNNMSNIQRGMYILTIQDSEGNIILNNKLIKD